MEQRVVRSLCMLCGVLVLVYRAFFRSIDETSLLYYPTKDTIVTPSYSQNSLDNLLNNDLTGAGDPFRDKAPEITSQPSNQQASRVQVVTTKNEPVVIDGLRFHPTSDLFDENSSVPSSTAQSSIPNMYLWNGTPKIVDYLGLSNQAKIIYKDIHNTHLIVLTNFDLNQWKNAIKAKGGSLLAISSQIDRNNRGLFGDNAYQLTIPKYRTTKMIWLIQNRNDWWYVQIDKDWYDGLGKEFVKNALSSYYSQ